MTEEAGASLDHRLATETETYIASITDCVHRVPTLLAAYERDAAYRDTALEIGRLESACDRTHREIGRLVSTASVADVGLRNTRIHLNSAQIIELYQRLDEIPNAAEQVAESLRAIEPPRREAQFDQFQAMAETATTAIDVLAGAVRTFVDLLCSHGETGTIVDEIVAVRDAESHCDVRRNAAVADAFAADDVARPLVYREFAHLLDELLDAMEDVTDQLVLVSATESWITTAPDA